MQQEEEILKSKYQVSVSWLSFNQYRYQPCKSYIGRPLFTIRTPNYKQRTYIHSISEAF